MRLTLHLVASTGIPKEPNFIKWITASVASQSKSVNDAPAANVNLAKLDETILSPLKDIKDLRTVDPDHVILVGKCQRTKLPYLIKYERNTQQIKLHDFTMDSTLYLLSGCYPVGGDYFEWSDGEGSRAKVNAGELLGVPSCPHCGNVSAFGVCSCDGIMCINEPGIAVCPWCGKEVVFSEESSSKESFDVNRVRG
ncbi:TerY-C metal binding domain-containing protein [Thiothrix lacustris]|uniref:TerY-C metal binding domain-containing protein n=1 Tax=Thiothrix lacustris TaxID=525917 RepID=UPI0027E42AC2|nr:TerY-C metal binding domain-containing protein [Thiothrix lacustris]WMP18044.1 TerY-C metal binding domain-containing protein [Thiothrix lacustris]